MNDIMTLLESCGIDNATELKDLFEGIATVIDGEALHDLVEKHGLTDEQAEALIDFMDRYAEEFWL